MPGPGGESVKPAPKEQLYKLPEEVTPEEIAAFDENDPVDPEAVLRWLETGEADPWRESSGQSAARESPGAGFRREHRRRRRFAATLARLTTARLPGSQDSPTLVPPVLRAWARRVPGFKLWLFFTFHR
jgi:hypothetical protein